MSNMFDDVVLARKNRSVQAVNKVDTLCTTAEIDRITNSFFRFYQKDMWNIFKETLEYQKQGKNAWIFRSGTGTGKTEIFKFIPPYLMAKAKEEGNNEGLVFGLICHRLCLIQDLKNRVLPAFTLKPNFNDSSTYYKNLAGCGLDPDKLKFYIVNSNTSHTTVNKDKNLETEHNDEEAERYRRLGVIDLPNAKHVKNIDSDELKAEIERNRKAGIHSMFISLYQSVGRYHKKMSELNFDFVICDECHALNNMGRDVFEGCGKFFKTVKANYFFSASTQFDPADTRHVKHDMFVQTSTKTLADAQNFTLHF